MASRPQTVRVPERRSEPRPAPKAPRPFKIAASIPS